MRPRITILLLVLALGLGAYIYWTERHLPDTRTAQELEAKVFHLDLASITKIEWKPTDAPITLVKSTVQPASPSSPKNPAPPGQAAAEEPPALPNWEIETPIKDAADSELVQRLIEHFGNLTIRQTLSPRDVEESKLSAETLGIEHGIKLTLHTETGSETLSLGRPTPYPFSFYAKKGQSEDILVIQSPEVATSPQKYATSPLQRASIEDPKPLPEVLESPPIKWRDTRLLRMDFKELTRFNLKRPGGGEIELTRESKDFYWDMTKPLVTRGARTQADNFFEGLLLTNIIEPLSTDQFPSGPEPIQIDLSTPDQNATLWFQIQELPSSVSSEVENSNEAPTPQYTVLAKSSLRPGVFKVGSHPAIFLGISPNDLRDDRLTRIDPESLHGIRIFNHEGEEVRLERPGAMWETVQGERRFMANTDRIRKLIAELNQSPVRFTSDTATDLAPYGLDKPILTLELRNLAALKEPLTAPASPTGGLVRLHLGLEPNERRTVYAKFEGEPFVYQALPRLLTLLQTHPSKWRGLEVLRIPNIAVSEVEIVTPGAPPFVLSKPLNQPSWTARYGAQDVTPSLMQFATDELIANLSVLQAQDWMTETQEALVALQKPALSIRIVTQSQNAKGEIQEQEQTLKFSPFSENQLTDFFYGQLNQEPDVFLVPRETIAILTRSVLTNQPNTQLPAMGELPE